jgi:hypothetical protein
MYYTNENIIIFLEDPEVTFRSLLLKPLVYFGHGGFEHSMEITPYRACTHLVPLQKFKSNQLRINEVEVFYERALWHSKKSE